jgi:hypothetical protein
MSIQRELRLNQIAQDHAPELKEMRTPDFFECMYIHPYMNKPTRIAYCRTLSDANRQAEVHYYGERDKQQKRLLLINYNNL